MFFTAVIRNKISFHTFPMKAIPSVFDEVKLAVNEMKIPNTNRDVNVPRNLNF